MTDSQPASARLLASFEDEYEIDEAERAALHLAGEHLDKADQLDAAVERHGVMIAGSSGQLVLNPAVAESRQQRAAAWNIVRRLMADDEGDAVNVDAASMGQAEAGMAARSPASIRATEAARARWGRARAANGVV